MKNAERPGKAAQSQAHARYKPGAWEEIGRCKPGTCEVHAWYKPRRSHPGVREPGRRTERWLAAGLDRLLYSPLQNRRVRAACASRIAIDRKSTRLNSRHLGILYA